jgi:ABC-type antimicrobial peptide transport system permease subunit
LGQTIDNAVKDQLSAKYFYNLRGTLDDKYNDLKQKTAPTFYSILLVMCFILLNALFGYFTLSYYQVKHRRNEIGVRRAIGATKTRIYLKIITENVMLMITGSVIGVLVFYQLKILVFDSRVWQYFQTGLLLAIGISLITTIVTTLYPAYLASKVQPVEALAEE